MRVGKIADFSTVINRVRVLGSGAHTPSQFVSESTPTHSGNKKRRRNCYVTVAGLHGTGISGARTIRDINHDLFK